MKPDHPDGQTRLFRYEFFTNYQSFFAPLSADIFTLPAACSNL